MSILKHATLPAWQRDEHGRYRAEINGWELRVDWHPAEAGRRRGFTWQVARPGAPVLKSDELFEEIELAMAEAETVAAPASTG